MVLVEAKVKGYRGFSTFQHFKPAIPNGTEGSGISIVVGGNNSGKTSLLEALSWCSSAQTPSITEKQRNRTAGDKITLKVRFDDEELFTLESARKGSSEMVWIDKRVSSAGHKFFFVPARREFNHSFSKNSMERGDYSRSMIQQGLRGTSGGNFATRLFRIHNKPEYHDMFSQLLGSILGKELDWTIDLNDSRQHYIRVTVGNHTYTSEGLGQGIISMLYIADALYDSKPGDTILIDEPELSLQPNVVRRLAKQLRHFAKDRQIIISTHSPYLIDWKSINNGGKLIRCTTSERTGSVFNYLTKESLSLIPKILKDTHNPHTLDLLGREVFFQDEGIVLVEGQEDVVYFEKILDTLGLELDGWFFGWGVGGADKMSHICHILVDLGYKKVVGIVDGDKTASVPVLKKKYSNYKFCVLPAEDIRFKKSQSPKPEKDGIWKNGKLQNKYKDDMIELINQVNQYLVEQ